jgi:hypothetical protein
MSIDKTLHLTEASGSEINSFYENGIKIAISEFPDQLYGETKLCCSHSLKNLCNE